MRVFLTGGRGEVGAPILKALVAHGHQVAALARSSEAAAEMALHGATSVRGDLADPQAFRDDIVAADAVIHTAATFDDEEATLDDRFVSMVIDAATARATPLRVLYTGGCWLYGETGERVADENAPFDAPESFRWAVDHAARLLAADQVDAIIMHPAMVYGDGGGVFDRFIAEARRDGVIALWQDGAIRWPVVHRDDLADAYLRALEAGLAGGHYNVSAEDGVTTRQIADAVARRFGARPGHLIKPRADVLADDGMWGEGPMIDQQMSAERIRTTLGWTPKHKSACAFVEADMKIDN